MKLWILANKLVLYIYNTISNKLSPQHFFLWYLFAVVIRVPQKCSFEWFCKQKCVTLWSTVRKLKLAQLQWKHFWNCEINAQLFYFVVIFMTSSVRDLEVNLCMWDLKFDLASVKSRSYKKYDPKTKLIKFNKKLRYKSKIIIP